jgi:hypothetical protein
MIPERHIDERHIDERRGSTGARPSREGAHPRPTRAPAPKPAELLTWYRERDGDERDLHRRYVRAKYGMGRWSDADLARFHRYRRSVSRERAAQLVIARRYAIRGLSALALAALVAGLVYAAIRWWKHRAAPPALPKKTPKSEVPS